MGSSDGVPHPPWRYCVRRVEVGWWFPPCRPASHSVSLSLSLSLSTARGPPPTGHLRVPVQPQRSSVAQCTNPSPPLAPTLGNSRELPSCWVRPHLACPPPSLPSNPRRVHRHARATMALERNRLNRYIRWPLQYPRFLGRCLRNLSPFDLFHNFIDREMGPYCIRHDSAEVSVAFRCCLGRNAGPALLCCWRNIYIT